MLVNSTTNTDILKREKNAKYVDPNDKSYFKEELNKQNKEIKEEPEEVKRSDEELLEDIYSLLRTGLTKAEIEELEKLKEEILKRIEQEEKNPSNKGIKKIEELIDKLNNMILQLKKRANGVAVKDASNKDGVPSTNDLQTSKKEDNSTDPIMNLQVLVDAVDEATEEIKKLKGTEIQKKPSTTTQEELDLIEQLKNS